MHDLATRLLGQNRLGQQADPVITFDEAAGVVEEEAAIEVAVPGDTEVGAVFLDRPGGGVAVFRQQRVGDAVGEVAIGFVEDADELERQLRCKQVDDQAGAAVAGVDHQL